MAYSLVRYDIGLTIVLSLTFGIAFFGRIAAIVWMYLREPERGTHTQPAPCRPWDVFEERTR